MSARPPIPIEPIPIAVDSAEFEAICGWAFVDDYVRALHGWIAHRDDGDSAA